MSPDSTHNPTHKPAIKPGRRALSCTECKRRKTKCSALGKTPCDACVKRGRPGDCVWLDASDQGRAAFALTTELDSLRNEVKELRSLLSRPAPSVPLPISAIQPPLNDIPTQSSSSHVSFNAPPERVPTASNFPNSSASSPILPSAPASASTATSKITASGKVTTSTSPTYVVESTVSAMEELIIGPLPGTRVKARKTSFSNGGGGGGSGGDGVGFNSHSPNNYTDHNWRQSSACSMANPKDDQNVKNKWLLEAIHYTLPDPMVGKVLLDDYFDGPVHKGWRVVHQPQFMMQFQRYASLPLDERKSKSDPAWLALYLSILALSVKFLSTEDLLFPMFAPEDLAKMPGTFYQASLNALEVANCAGIAQIYHIQAHFGESPIQANNALRHFDSAVTTIQWLNMDILTNDPASAPLDDPALEGLSPTAAHELCKRLVHLFSFLDGVMLRRAETWRMHKVTTPLPSNKNLSEIDEPERPNYEFTEATMMRVGSEVAKIIRKYHIIGDLTWEEVVEYDRALRLALNFIPPTTLSLDRAWMIYIVFCSIHNRLLRIHRPHMTRGYTDPARGMSRLASVDSAKRIIEIQWLFKANPRLQPNFVKRWIIGASFVLAVDYMLGNASSRVGLNQALELCTQPNPFDRSPDITREGARTIEALLAVADARANSVRAATVEEDLNALLDEVKSKMQIVEETLPMADFDFNQFFTTLQGFDFSNGLLTPSQMAAQSDQLRTNYFPFDNNRQLQHLSQSTQSPTPLLSQSSQSPQVINQSDSNQALPPLPLYHTLLPPELLANWPPANVQSLNAADNLVQQRP